MKPNQTEEKFDEVADILTTLILLEIDSESFNSILDELPVYLWMHDENHNIVYGNQGFKAKFGGCQKKTCYQSLMGEKEVCSCCLSQKTLENVKPERCNLCKRGTSGYDINMFHTPITYKDGQKLILKSSHHLKDLSVLVEKMLPATEVG